MRKCNKLLVGLFVILVLSSVSLAYSRSVVMGVPVYYLDDRVEKEYYDLLLHFWFDKGSARPEAVYFMPYSGQKYGGIFQPTRRGTGRVYVFHGESSTRNNLAHEFAHLNAYAKSNYLGHDVTFQVELSKLE